MFNNIGHNPYFSRWFSAITNTTEEALHLKGHNPYFSRWFSAIDTVKNQMLWIIKSQSLF